MESMCVTHRILVMAGGRENWRMENRASFQRVMLRYVTSSWERGR